MSLHDFVAMKVLERSLLGEIEHGWRRVVELHKAAGTHPRHTMDPDIWARRPAWVDEALG